MKIITMFLIALLVSTSAFAGGSKPPIQTPYQQCYSKATSTCDALQPGINAANPNTKWIHKLSQTVLTTYGEKGHIVAAEYNYYLNQFGERVEAPLKGTTFKFNAYQYSAYYDPTKATWDPMTFYTCQGLEVDKCECQYLGKDC